MKFMSKYCSLVFLLLGLCVSNAQPHRSIPNEFVKVSEELPEVLLDIKYASQDNFVGRVIVGYENPQVVITRQAMVGLKCACNYFKNKGFGVKIFDAYRPQKAVNDFVQWSKQLGDTLMKSNYYPDVEKSRLFEKGYIASRSGHSRGSTLDLTLVDLTSGKDLNMGSDFDFFGEISHTDSDKISETEKENRLILKTGMLRCGFKAYSKEWWHFTLEEEPFLEAYFDF